MNKKALILALSIIMLTGCGNKKDDSKSTENNKSSVESTEKVKDDNKSNTKEEDKKIIGGEEKGEGNIALSTPGGEGKDVTLITEKDSLLVQIGINAEDVDVDGNEPTVVYVDGKENTKLQLSKDMAVQDVIDLQEENLTEGKHIVEVIQEKDGQQTFYRQLSYEVKH